MDNTITALDTQTLVDVGLVQPEPDQTADSDSQPTDAVETQEPTDTNTTTPVTTVSIDGLGDVSLDEIKEWKQGNLRQSDYTKKTQELARLREEANDALEVFNYLKQNPQLVEQLKSMDTGKTVNQNIVNKTTPENEMMRQLWYNQKSMELDKKVADLKSKYGEVDEVELYNAAAAMHTDDLEFVYKAMAFDKNRVDEQAMKQRIMSELKAELQQNKSATSTVASTNATTPPVNVASLTNEEKRVAEAMGLTSDEYAKWKNK